MKIDIPISLSKAFGQKLCGHVWGVCCEKCGLTNQHWDIEIKDPVSKSALVKDLIKYLKTL